MPPPALRSLGITLRPDRGRVLLRPFHSMSDQRALAICARVMALPEGQVRPLLERLLAAFQGRHRGLREFLKKRFDEVQPYLPAGEPPSEERAWLLGAYFSSEFAFEGAALFNPSLVPHPDPRGAAAGSLRVLLSLRATGEGHVSSIVFRSGTLDAGARLVLDAASEYGAEPAAEPGASFEKTEFERQLEELGLAGGLRHQVLKALGPRFTLRELTTHVRLALQQLRAPNAETEAQARQILLLARSNYTVKFDPDSPLAERVLFPATPSQSNGIEDARFVRFQDESGLGTYYATYTAYDGRRIQPQLLETSDFLQFKFVTLSGAAVQNKGMALFPRKIGGRYAMLGRQDYENIYLLFSEHLHFWSTAQHLLAPAFPWEFVQLGNCGSPIETAAGWLVLSHGVGPMREYCIGAFLLDLGDPGKVIGRLREPLIAPNSRDRDGYVPNVVYSCGSLLHEGQLVIPYGVSDCTVAFAAVPLGDLLAAMR